MADIQPKASDETPINPILAQVERINKANTPPQTTPVQTDVPEEGVTEVYSRQQLYLQRPSSHSKLKVI